MQPHHLYQLVISLDLRPEASIIISSALLSLIVHAGLNLLAARSSFRVTSITQLVTVAFRKNSARRSFNSRDLRAGEVLRA